MMSFASIIFSDPFFAPYLPSLVKLVLFSAAMHQICYVASSTMDFAVGQVQDTGLIFLSAMARTVVDDAEAWRRRAHAVTRSGASPFKGSFPAPRVPFPSVAARRTPLSLRAGDGARFSPRDGSVGLARAGTASARDFALARIAIALWCATHRRCATFSDCCLCSRSARSSPGAVPPPEASGAPSSAAASGYV